MDWNTLFNVEVHQINNNLQLSIFEVKELNQDVINFLDENLVSICEGKYSYSEISIVKQRIFKLFKNKNTSWKMGSISEFFIHLYMNLTGYSQECLFLNLEEGSIKKGFDGYYTIDSIHWIMESKSGSYKTQGISHKSKLKEAIKDLNDKFSGNSSNNIWQNAYNHASHSDVGTPPDIKKSIKNFSEEYVSDNFYTIEDFNIVPCATIFLDSIWKPVSKSMIINEVRKLLEKEKYKRAHLICVTQASIDIFNQYIEL